MTCKNRLREADIKNHIYYYFDDIIRYFYLLQII